MSIGAWFKNSITELRSRNLRGAPKTDVVHASGAREGGRSIVPTVDMRWTTGHSWQRGRCAPGIAAGNAGRHFEQKVSAGIPGPHFL